MKYCIVLLFVKLVFIPKTFCAEPQLVTILDEFKNISLFYKTRALNDTLENMDTIFGENIKQGKIQWRVPDTQAFPCDVSNTRSLVTPNSVDKLRPGDIDVIACMGDSLAAANGAISTTMGHIINEYRSLSFCGGGRANWRKFVTLPNILKVFNPNLYGYATSDGSTLDRQSRLNIAEAMLWTRDLTFQIKTLLKRMRTDPNVNMKNHWKMLTIFVGNNDICTDMCHHDSLEDFLQILENDLLESLRMLKDNVPRLVVNVLPVININTIFEMEGIPNNCTTIYKLGCHCFFKAQFKKNELNTYFRVAKEWQNRQEQITKRKEFRTQDFAVIYQPLSRNVVVPLNRSGKSDLRAMASDCFHLSQLGHALAANALWNNVMQPEGFKQETLYPLFERFECPTDERPFIAI